MLQEQISKSMVESTFKKIGNDVYVDPTSRIKHPKRISLGNHVAIDMGVYLSTSADIGDYVHIAPGVAIAGGVKVGEGTLIGVGTSIVPYVTVGKWATIGAGSAVISDIPDYSTAVGVPAIIKKINNESI